MSEQPKSGSQQKIYDYADRIEKGLESRDSVFKGLTESFKSAIDKRLNESAEEKEAKELAQAQRHEADQKKIEDLKNKLGINKSPENVEVTRDVLINYIDVVIDDEYMQKNLMPNGGLRMLAGQANWKGEVDLVRYSISDKLSPQYQEFAADKIEKSHAAHEKTYQHELHHIQNRENGLTPNVAAENMREFLAFRVLDEISAFSTAELFDKEMTAEEILQALKTSEKSITASYYGEPFQKEAKWYTSQHGNKSEAFSRTINQEKYHKIMRQYFKINGKDILSILQKENKMAEFTALVNNLILKLDPILDTVRP